MAYLEGVMGVRSLPKVSITLRPHTHSPAQMPTPPYRSNQIGVGALDTTEPLSYRSQRATSGPIALLVIEISCVNLLNECAYTHSTEDTTLTYLTSFPPWAKEPKHAVRIWRNWKSKETAGWSTSSSSSSWARSPPASCVTLASWTELPLVIAEL